ncbi:hypothetical protein [Bacillus sp. USDA818B3_A]|uniref:hypothetical protein n=1 Tax=Bacillus sp. USDA818B3_A TaxID=2698834 RepID=UPI00136AC423|nr:hypothetical protein [Bacillus sp. USDA818B3_A]
MNKKALGAITMVLVGSVTFSITNNLLTDQPAKPLPQENNIPISDSDKTVVNNNPKEKKVQAHTPKIVAEEPIAIHTVKEEKAVSEIKNEVPTVSDKPVTQQTATNKATVQIQKKNTPTVSAVSPTDKTTTSAPSAVQEQKTTNTVSTKQATATKTLPSQPSTSKTTTNTSTTTNTTTTTANHGQQVSEEAKAKAVTRKEQKEDNGKKK